MTGAESSQTHVNWRRFRTETREMGVSGSIVRNCEKPPEETHAPATGVFSRDQLRRFDPNSHRARLAIGLVLDGDPSGNGRLRGSILGSRTACEQGGEE